MTMTFGYFVLIAGGVLVAVVVLATVVKLIEVRKAARWPTTHGKVVVSKSEARSVKGTANTPRTGNFARVEYEYQVKGRKLRGKRVSIGEEAPDFRVVETLERYPLGARVTVYYDPQDPAKAVLERELPTDFFQGLGIALIYFGGGTVAVFMYFTRGVDWLSSRLPQGSSGTVTAVAGALGAFSALLAWALGREARRARAWHPETAEIVAAAVEQYQDASGDRNVTRRRYVPRITYRYAYQGREYQGDRLHLGGALSFSSEALARARLAAYPIGASMRVLVNPDNPANATLEARARHVWVLWCVAALLLAVAWLASRGTG